MSWSDGIPWVIAVLGWGAAHVFSEARERRKEIRAQIDKLHDHLYGLEQDARTFHCSPNFDLIKNGNLVSKISLLERQCQRISILSTDNLNPHIMGIRRSITLKNFDKSTFKELPPNNELIQDISHNIQDLEDAIEREYRIRYPHKFPYFKLRK